MIQSSHYQLDERIQQLGLPRLPLSQGPTPLQLARPWHAWLRNDRVFVKRDDLCSPLYGGNKVRRFEYLFAQAKAQSAHHLITVGGLASTQVTATAVLGGANGFCVSAVLFDQPVTRFAKAALRQNMSAGARLIYGGGYAATIYRTLKLLKQNKGQEAFFIEPGAGTPLANLGYVTAVLELNEQLQQRNEPPPDFIVVPSGSCGTVAALALGCALLGWPTEVVGVRITLAIACNRLLVWQRIHGLQKLLGVDAQVHAAPRFSLYGNALGSGYGYPTEAAKAGAKEWAGVTGVEGEVTYSGKAMAALRELTHPNPDKSFLFWNTLSSVVPPVTPDADERLRQDPAFSRLMNQPEVA